MASPIRAIAFTAPKTAELVELPPDDVPLGPLEVAGPAVASLVSPGTELNWGFLGQTFPTYTGYACIFEVSRVGDGVKDFRAGDLAFCMGNHRSWQRHAREAVLPVPAGLAPDVAVFGRLMGVSMSTLVTTAARPPSRVLVTGLGPVGNLAAQIFASCGYEVTACDPVASRQALAQSLGLRDVRASVAADDPLAGTIVLHVECSGHEQAVLDGCRLVRKRGEVVLVGVPWRKRTDIAAFDVLREVFHRYVELRSGWEWELPTKPADFAAGSIHSNIAGAMAWLTQGRVRVDGLALKLSPSEAQRAYQGLLDQTLERPAVVFDWTRNR